MRKFELIFVFLFTCILFAQQSGKQFYEYKSDTPQKYFKADKVLYPGDSTFDVTYYGLNLTLDYNSRTLTGIVTVSAKSKENDLTSIFLDLQNPLTVTAVKLNNQDLSFTHANAKLNITLDKVYSLNEPFSVTVYYHGTPGSSGFGSFAFDTLVGHPAIYTLSEPYGASDWWPCKDTPADKADSSDMWITCASNFIPVSNGTLVDTVNNGNGTHTYHWKNNYPIAQYLISMAISDYVTYTNYFHYAPADSMPIVNYIYPEQLSSYKPVLDKVPQMLQIFSNKFELYPFITEKYGHAEFGFSGGMEHQTIASIGTYAFTEGVLAHELTHQWFGDKVTCKDWQNIWLNEGFATFGEALYYEYEYGEANYKSTIDLRMDAAKNAVGSVYVQDISTVASIFDYYRSYAKGCVVLYMLRNIVGDTEFFQILRNYLDDPLLAYNSATTEDFQAHAEAVYGSSLNYFFHEWIYGENFPDYSINWNYHPIGNNQFSITLDINQSVNSNPAYFTMPVQVKIGSAFGDTLITLFNNQQNQQFIFTVNGLPSSLTFDPDNHILKDITITSVGELQTPLKYELSQNYPNPFNPTTKISYSLSQRSMVTLKLYNSIGEKVLTLVNKEEDGGVYTISLDGKNLSSGVYFYRIEAVPLNNQKGNFVDTKKMIHLK